MYSGAWKNYAWHKLYIEKQPLSGESILLQGIHIARDEDYDKGMMALVHFLLCVYLQNDRQEEFNTHLQSVVTPWTEHPLGSVYFWEVAPQSGFSEVEGTLPPQS